MVHALWKYNELLLTNYVLYAHIIWYGAHLVSQLTHTIYSASLAVQSISKIIFFLFQAIELASEVLANVKFIQEKKLIGI